MAPGTPLIVQRESGVDYVTLHRPAVRNTLDDSVIAALTQWADAAAQDSDLRLAVLSGSGKTFCSGADLAWMAHAVDYDYEQNLHEAWALSRLFARLDTLPFPPVGRLHGAALAAGVGLAAVCDVSIATEDTVFGLTEVKLDVIPAVISPYVVAKIGASAARHLFLTGERFSARRAYQLGLVHQVPQPDALDTTVERVVGQLRAAGPKAIAAAKALIAAVNGRPPAKVAELTVETIADLWVTEEAQDGMRAFLDKRTPGWLEGDDS